MQNINTTAILGWTFIKAGLLLLLFSLFVLALCLLMLDSIVSSRCM